MVSVRTKYDAIDIGILTATHMAFVWTLGKYWWPDHRIYLIIALPPIFWIWTNIRRSGWLKNRSLALGIVSGLLYTAIVTPAYLVHVFGRQIIQNRVDVLDAIGAAHFTLVRHIFPMAMIGGLIVALRIRFMVELEENHDSQDKRALVIGKLKEGLIWINTSLLIALLIFGLAETA
jgi:predicted histidine transporter YuiF (NhaC family)